MEQGQPQDRPSRRQYRLARAATRWYIRDYYGTPHDPGVSAMFCDPNRVGAFAVEHDALKNGCGRSLFRVLIATAMFQRRQDAQILRILRGLSSPDVEELTDPAGLLARADQSPCEHLASSMALKDGCDLYKDPVSKMGDCLHRPSADCHLKRHTVLLKRYGHFGKVPTSIALVLREAGAADPAELHRVVTRSVLSRKKRAVALEEILTRAWRVNSKIAAMFLSITCNEGLTGDTTPWSETVDSTRFVVIDSNVDLFLKAIDYSGAWSYERRRAFIIQLARRIDLRGMDTRLRRTNPRLVQQAMYLFMSVSNRRQSNHDCALRVAENCPRCDPAIQSICPLRL